MSDWTMGEGVDEQLSELMENARLECLRLLDSARFSTWRDSHLNGALTAVSILARPDRIEPDTCRIDVICNSAGHLRVDWERVPLELVDNEVNRVLARGVLDSQGRSMFTLPYGAQERSLRFRDPVITLDLPVLAFALQFGGTVELPSSNQSEQLSIRYTIEGTIPQRILKITVGALDPSLRGSTVRVEIRSRRSGKLQHSEPVDLTFGGGMVGNLEVREELLRIPEAGDLKIEAQPLVGGI